MASSQISIQVEPGDREELGEAAAAVGWSLSTYCARVLAGYLRSTETRRERVLKLGLLAEGEQRVAP